MRRVIARSTDGRSAGRPGRLGRLGDWDSWREGNRSPLRVAANLSRFSRYHAVARWLYAFASLIFFALAMDAELDFLFPKGFVHPVGAGYVLWRKSASKEGPIVCGLLSIAICLLQDRSRISRRRLGTHILCSVCCCICMCGYMWINPAEGFGYLRDPFVHQPWWHPSPFLSRLRIDRVFLLAQTTICLVSILSVASAFAMRSTMARRRLAGVCSSCDYDLAGNVSGICPECGSPVGVDSGTSSGNRRGSAFPKGRGR